jgi:NADH-quinone oxidoreductase subunit L
LQVALFLKAAQWFFYPWLLDAMEAPVPISAQLHSSTLVVIGFYLFFRFQPLFELAPITAQVAIFAGFCTSVGAAILGFFQEDGKKLLACSTASQLGYVIVALGLQLYTEALYLLTFCCCNKAATFVWFGMFMRRHAGVSDFRVIAGQGLTWVEHAGLFLAIANFTVFPGAFC